MKRATGSDITLAPKIQNSLAKTLVAEFTQAALYLANSGASTFSNTSADKLAVESRWPI